MSDMKRILLTHVNSDHAQAPNEIKKRTYSITTTSASAYDAAGGAKVYAHWIAYFAHTPPYHGPPDIRIYRELFQKYDLKTEDVIKKFGKQM